jgi:hypothetical protein
MHEFKHSLDIDSICRSQLASTGSHHQNSLTTNDYRNLQSHQCVHASGRQTLETVAPHSWNTVGQSDRGINGSISTDPLSDSSEPIPSTLEPGTYEVQVQAVTTSARHVADGFTPTPSHDLVFHGGKTIANLQFANLYIGGYQSWNPNEIQAIDGSLSVAMSDPRLNTVVAQYFPNQSITSQFLGSQVLAGSAPTEVSQTSLESYISYLDQTGFFQGANLQSTVFNFVLPEGTILSEGNFNSLEGLGGFHGSVHVQNAGRVDTVYYATSVYSADYGYVTNGIPAFPKSWENVVATLYHELNEARTDPDVEDANRTGNNAYLGWTSPQGDEIGDYPVTEAGTLGDLGYVFEFAPLTNGLGAVPIQLLYSNAVHGPEDPTA